MRRLALFLLLVAPCLALGTVTKEQIIRDLRTLLQQQKEDLCQAENKAADAKKLVTKAETDVRKISGERDGWRAYGESMYTQMMNAEKRVAEKTSAILRRDMIISALVVIAGVYLFLKFYLHIPI